MWNSLRYRIALLVLASLASDIFTAYALSSLNVSPTAQPSPHQLAVLFILIALMILVLGLSYLSFRQFVVPLRLLKEIVAAIAEGDFHAAEEPIGGVREIEQLRESLDHMAKQVLAAQDAVEFYIGRTTYAQEEERKRLARELHDDTIQAVVVMGQHLDMLPEKVRLDEPVAAAVSEVRTQVSCLSDSLRRIASDLRPPYLEDLGLLAALRELVQESGAEIEVTGSEYPIGEDRELALYRIIQEALRNAAAHASAQRIAVRISYQPDQLVAIIEDDGEGFDVPPQRTVFARTRHLGLTGMQERARLIGGQLHISSQRGAGTRVEVRIPVIAGMA